MPIATSTIIGGLVLATAAYYATRADDKDEDELEPLPGGFLPGISTGTAPPSVQITQATFQPTAPPAAPMDLDPGATPTGYPWETNPPAMSGSYDEELFSSNYDVRKTMGFLGYDTPSAAFGFELNMAPDAGEVRKFQRHYNKATERGFRSANGYLDDDGVAGKRTLRALEYAAFGTNKGTPDDILRGPEWMTEFDLWA